MINLWNNRWETSIFKNRFSFFAVGATHQQNKKLNHIKWNNQFQCLELFKWPDKNDRLNHLIIIFSLELRWWRSLGAFHIICIYSISHITRALNVQRILCCFFLRKFNIKCIKHEMRSLVYRLTKLVMVDGREHIPWLCGSLSKQLQFPTNKWLLLSLGKTSRLHYLNTYFLREKKAKKTCSIHYAG